MISEQSKLGTYSISNLKRINRYIYKHFNNYFENTNNSIQYLTDINILCVVCSNFYTTIKSKKLYASIYYIGLKIRLKLKKTVKINIDVGFNGSYLLI